MNLISKLWHKLLCHMSNCVITFWHDVELIEVYDPCTRKLKCRHCGGYFAMSDRYQAILPWDEEYEQIMRMMYGIPRSKV